MFPEYKVTEIYCMADDFCKEFTLTGKYMIEDKRTRHRNKPNCMSDAVHFLDCNYYSLPDLFTDDKLLQHILVCFLIRNIYIIDY